MNAMFLDRLGKGLIGAGLLAVGASALGFAGRYGWFFELASHFRVQYVVALLLSAVLLLPLRRRHAALCFALCAAVNLTTILPLYKGSVGTAVAAAPSLQVLSLNVRSENRSYERVKAAVNAYDPDVIVFQEITPKWVEESTLC